MEDQLLVGRYPERKVKTVEEVGNRTEREGGKSRTRPGGEYHCTEYCGLDEAAEGEGYE
jgi:hypothetical protein